MRCNPKCIAIVCLLVGWTAFIKAADGPNQPPRSATSRPETSRPKLGITISKETTYLVAPLRETGGVDYVAALNEMLSKGVTPENNAVVLMYKALGDQGEVARTNTRFFELLNVPPPAVHGNYLIPWHRFIRDRNLPPEANDQFDKAFKEPWSASELPLVAEWLAKNEVPLAIVMEATRRPRYFQPLVGGNELPTLLSVLLPAAQDSRELARPLAARAMRNIQVHRLDDAWGDILALHRLARLVSQGPFLIDALVGAAIESMACQAETALANSVKLDAKSALKYLSQLQSFPSLTPAGDKVGLGERFIVLDAVRWLAEQGLGRLSAINGNETSGSPVVEFILRIVGGILVDWDETLKAVNRWFDRLAAAFHLPTYSKRQERIAAIERESVALRKRITNTAALADEFKKSGSLRKAIGRRMGDLFIVLLVPGISAAASADARVVARQRLSQMALAIAAFRADKGRLPQALNDLSPAYLKVIPTDPFTEVPLLFRVGPDALLVYSAGPNGKDDGGKEPGPDTSADDVVVRIAFKPNPSR